MQEVIKELQPKWNAVIVDVFAAFIRICEQYGLRYFCAGGTAIGAVRHQGMIPWDDATSRLRPLPCFGSPFDARRLRGDDSL